MTDISKSDCREYSGYDKPINKNFYFLNGHGGEMDDDYEIPKGVRIIMFCYSGAILDICHKFDRFNWNNILLDPTASSNYCTFLAAISKYSSVKDHFCVYEENDVIKNIELLGDKYFREGLFRLPVKGFGYDEETKSVVISSHSLMSDTQTDKKFIELTKNLPRTHILVDDKKLIELMRKKNDVAIFQTSIKQIKGRLKLSNLINSIRLHEDQFTLLLMVCREGEGSEEISKGKKVGDEVERMQRHLILERALR